MAFPATSPVSPEAPLSGELSSVSETERVRIFERICFFTKVQLAARSGPFSFASQPSGWFADSSILWGCSFASYYTPSPLYQNQVFLSSSEYVTKIVYFLVRFDGGGGIDAALYNLSVIIASLLLALLPSAFALRQMPVLEPQAITAKNESPAKGSPTRATTTTAASGGLREELSRMQAERNRCWEPQPGSRR